MKLGGYNISVQEATMWRESLRGLLWMGNIDATVLKEAWKVGRPIRVLKRDINGPQRVPGVMLYDTLHKIILSELLRFYVQTI